MAVGREVEVKEFIKGVAKHRSWPLLQVVASDEVELPARRYVLLVLEFDTSFDEADKLLQELYSELDESGLDLADIFLDVRGRQ